MMTEAEQPVLVNTQESSVSSGSDSEIKAPRWVAVVGRAVALVSASMWTIVSLWVFIRGLLSISCILAAILMLAYCFTIFCIEASFLCQSVRQAQPLIGISHAVKYYHKGGFYIGVSTIIYFMCRDAWLASGPGYLCSLAAGSVYLYGSLEHKKLTVNNSDLLAHIFDRLKPKQ